MRLTLRTLLAYMDDILDPSDQEELGRKIEASPFATELIHRSRDAVRRLRLSAPEVLSGEAGDLHDGDHNLDANTAAEYLDNTLSPDDVAEFERNCLEAGLNSDMLLAEAASCHHILTLVLGEPAEVDADLRQRMYALSRHSAPQQLRIEPAHASPTQIPAAQTPAPVAAQTPVQPMVTPAFVLPQRPAVDPDEAAVPDYLLEAARSRRRSRWLVGTLAVGALGGALIGGLATWLLWPGPEPTLPKDIAQVDAKDLEAIETGEIDIGEPVTGDATSGAPAADAPADGGTAPAWTPDATGATATEGSDAGTTPGNTGVGAVVPSTADAAVVSSAEGELPATSDLPAVVVDAPAAGDAPAATTTTPGPPAIPTPGDVAASGAPAPPAVGDAGATPPAVPPAAPTDMTAGAGIALAAGAGAAAASVPVEGATPPAAPGADMLAGADATLPPADGGADAGLGEFGESDDATAPAEPETPRTLGAYLGLNNDLLLHFDETAGSQGAWLRLPPRSTFATGSRLLTLPAFRTHVVLNPDVNAYLGGGTEITLLAPGDAGGAINVALPYGQLILNSGPSGNRIALVMGDQMRVISLGPSSSLAVEVRRTFLPGLDPAANPAPLEVSYYLTSGKAEWGDASVDAASGEDPGQSAEAPASWTTADGVDTAPQTIDKLPSWIDKEPITTLEAVVRDAIAETVAAGQPVNSALLELTSNTGLGRRTEVRALAVRGGSYVGEFEPLIKALSDPLERAKRNEQVGALRAAIARDPANVVHIHDAFELQLGKDAAEDLTEMVVGFSPQSIGTTKQQVQEGSMARLINWLDDDDLTYRVLASYNLNEITGTQYLGGYRPEHSASQRSREIQFYLKRFEAGELLPRP